VAWEDKRHHHEHPPSQTPGFWRRVQERKPWRCASPAQQQPKHLYGIDTVLATNTKHGNIWAAMKKVNFIPPSPTQLQPARCQYIIFNSAQQLSG